MLAAKNDDKIERQKHRKATITTAICLSFIIKPRSIIVYKHIAVFVVVVGELRVIVRRLRCLHPALNLFTILFL